MPLERQQRANECGWTHFDILEIEERALSTIALYKGRYIPKLGACEPRDRVKTSADQAPIEANGFIFAVKTPARVKLLVASVKELSAAFRRVPSRHPPPPCVPG